MTAFTALLARFLPDGDALREGVGAGKRGSRRRAGTRWAVSPAPSARKSAVAVRGAPCQRAAAKELHTAGRSQRAVEARVIERFIECGDPCYRLRKSA